MEWDISALLFRFGDLNATDPCPDYQAYSGETYLILEVNPLFPPTVSLCRWVIATFELCVQRWGVRAISFKFGAGIHSTEYQGIFQIGLGRPPRESILNLASGHASDGNVRRLDWS